MEAVAAPIKMVSSAATPDRREDAQWIAAALAGDTTAFEALYRKHLGRVHALCWRLCGANEWLAQEMTQDSFVRAWQKLHLFRGDSAFGTWLHRLTVNVVLGDKRSRMRRLAHEQPMEEIPDGLAKAKDAGPANRMDLEKQIARLPDRARTVLILHDIEGFRHAEIAEMADMAVGTSKAQLHRARKLLREYLEQ